MIRTGGGRPPGRDAPDAPPGKPATGGAEARIVRIARLPADSPDPGAQLAEELGSGLAQVLVFAASSGDFAAISASLQQAFPRIPVAGCTTAGEIDGAYLDEDILALGLPESHFATLPVIVPDLSDIDATALVGEMILARRALAAARPDFPHEFAFLMVDGLSLREDTLMEAISPGLGPVPLFGGSAGDGTRFERCLLSQDGVVMANSAILLFVRSSCPVKVFSFDHLEPGEDRMVVTGADPARRRVTEINAEPAAREYARILGMNPENLDPFVFAGHPLVVRVGGRYFVRSIQRVGDCDDLYFFSAIDEGVVLTIAKPDDMAQALDRSLADVVGAGALDTVFACDCILRRIEAQQKQSSRRVAEVLHRHRVVGFSTYGEQFGAMHVNLTMTGIAIFRPEPTSER